MYRLTRLFKTIFFVGITIFMNFGIQMKKQKAVLLLNPKLDNHKIKKVFINSFEEMTDYIAKNKDIKRVYIDENELTLRQMEQLLCLNKEIALFSTLETKKLIKLKNN